MSARPLPAKAPEDRLGKSVQILEDATGLLRTATATDYAFYFAGTLPFLWQLVQVWAKMSLSANAERELWPGAVTLAIAYLWMKVGQTLFVQRLLGILRNVPPQLGLRQGLRLTWSALCVQSSSLFVTLLAATLLVPTAWTIAFYHHAQATCDGSDAGLWKSVREAGRQSQQMPRSNHALLALHAAFTFIVFLDVWVLLLFVPQQLFTLFGLETWLLSVGRAPFNTTILVAAATLTFAVTDPWLKAAYAVRAFHAESVTTGYDLRVAWRRSWAARAAVLLLAIGAWLSPRVGRAEPPAAGISPNELRGSPGADGSRSLRLNRSLDEILQRDAFAWRAPRGTSEDAQSDFWLTRWLRKAADTMTSWLRPLGTSLKRLVEWILDFRGPSVDDSPTRPVDWGRVLSRGAVVLSIVIWGIPIAILLRRWRLRCAPPLMSEAEAAPVQPLPTDGLEATKQPASEWQRQAEEWLAIGDRRMAIRALFLGNLAYLFEVGQLAALRHKTVGDYRRDLERRAHVYPGIFSGYCSTAQVFESAFYGNHPVTDDTLERFTRDSAKLRQD